MVQLINLKTSPSIWVKNVYMQAFQAVCVMLSELFNYTIVLI